MDEVFDPCWWVVHILPNTIRGITSLFVWNRRSNPNLTAWMERMDIPNTRELQAYYAHRILTITGDLNVTPIVWQDVRDEGVPVWFLFEKRKLYCYIFSIICSKLSTSTIIQVWKGDDGTWGTYIDEAAKQGYNVILSTPWYLNYISYGKYNTPSSVMNLEFFKYYEVEPLMNFTGMLNS